MPFGQIHYFLRKVASLALTGFFKEIHIIGEENVPLDGPVIVCCTHHNMMLDPAILANTMHELRPLHYWAKASLFGHPIARKILLASGVIPVDRGSKDNQKLFAGTFQALAEDDAVGLFPEGTSYTLPRIVQVKDGASWAALEYVKWVAEGAKNKNNGKELVIIPAGITYTDKSKYRSSAVIEYGPPIHISDFKEQFLSGKEGDSRAAVKKLTHRIEQAMIELTINAPNWETLLAARTARDLLFDSWRNVPLDDFKQVGQTLVDLFSTPWDSDPSFVSLKKALITYHSLLKSTHLTNATISNLPLPTKKDIGSAHSQLPSRFSTILPLLRETIAVLIRLPFFLVPLVIHIPIYWTTRWIGNKSAHEEESMAQNKVVVGLLMIFTIYGFWFWMIWVAFWATPIGAIVAASTIWLLSFYHGKLIDDNYIRAKRLLSAYRVLVGIWGPQKWDLSVSALTPYTITLPPAPNPFLKLPESISTALARSTSSPTVPTITSTASAPSPEATSSRSTPSTSSSDKSSKRNSNKRPPTRRLVRHLLRARVEATRQLAAFLRKVDKEGVRVAASGFLVDVYGGGHDSLFTDPSYGVAVVGDETAELYPSGWRHGREVIRYLKDKGAMVNKIMAAEGGDFVEDEWAALSSDGELSSPEGLKQVKEEQELEWVVPGRK